MSDAIQTDRLTPVLVVMVNYRTARLSIECLHSLEAEMRSLPPGSRVALVDNNSGDGSVEQIAQAIEQFGWGDWVSLMPSDLNGGYAYGNNFAIRPALASENPPAYVLLLNPDTQIRPGAIQTLIDFMEQHPKAGIAGSGLEEADGTSWSIAFRFPSILSELEGGFRLGIMTQLLDRWTVPRSMTEEAALVDWLSGASLMIRREVFDSIGLMDEEYFLYFEETDFCLQAKRSGWENWYVPQSRVMHIAGQSTGVTVRTDRPKRLPTYWFDSRRRYFVKNHGVIYAALTDAAWLLGFTTWRLRRIVQRKPDTDPPMFLWDFFRNSVFLRGPIVDREPLSSS